MPTLEIRLDVPEGTTVSISGIDVGDEPASDLGSADRIETYWRKYLSDNGRKVFGAAARIQDFDGPGFTLEDIAQNLSLDYESVRSMHRTTGRSAKRWRTDHGSEEPIKFDWLEYSWDDSHSGMRTTYRLEDEMVDTILNLRH